MNTILTILSLAVLLPAFLIIVWAGVSRCKRCGKWCDGCDSDRHDRLAEYYERREREEQDAIDKARSEGRY